MLQCDGYKMFHGTATITPANGKPPFDVTGTWLYRPDVGYWYYQIPGQFASGVHPKYVSNIRSDDQ